MHRLSVVILCVVLLGSHVAADEDAKAAPTVKEAAERLLVVLRGKDARAFEKLASMAVPLSLLHI